MRYFLFILGITLFFSGCSEKNAFSRFNLSENQEFGINSIQSSKLQDKDKVGGIVSVVYLNEVYPKRTQKSEVFYVSLYLKDQTSTPIFTLNGHKPNVWIEQLPSDNEYAHLVNEHIAWNKHYVVSFAPQGDTLTFKITSGTYHSSNIIFKKDE